MANQTHSTITDPDLHEPKGISTAAVGRAYQSDGTGSGVWTRPMDLVASADTGSVASIEIAGLSSYRELIVVIEALNADDVKFVELELYSTAAAAYRTSGYQDSYVDTNDDLVAQNTSGLLLGRTFGSNIQYFTCIARLTNFNQASHKTSCHSFAVASNNYFPITGITATNEEGHGIISHYDTAEAHEKIKLQLSSGNILSSYYTVWGIKG